MSGTSYTVPNVIDFPRYSMKCSGENVTLCGIFHVVSRFPLHFMLYRGNLDCFSNRVLYTLQYIQYSLRNTIHNASLCGICCLVMWLYISKGIICKKYTRNCIQMEFSIPECNWLYLEEDHIPGYRIH